MKKIIAIVSLAVFTGFAFSVRASSSTETNITYLKVLQASNDIESVVQVLPDVERLWPQDPDTYLKTANQAAHTLGGALNSSSLDAKQAFLNLYGSLMAKSCPTNEAQAVSWVGQKREMILYYLNFAEVSNSKSNWIAVAQFVGEVRSRIIPNYTNQAVMLSVSMPDHPEILQKMVAENEQKKVTDALQQELRITGWQLSSSLLYNIPYGFRADTDFVKTTTTAAQLTKDEVKKLQGK